MSTTKSNARHAHTDGNVGAETVHGRGVGDIRLWVQTPDEYKHPLYLTKEEATRIADCLADLLDDMGL